MMRAFGALIVVVVAAGCPGGPPPADNTLTGIKTDIFNVSCSASVCHGGPNPVDGLDLVNKPFETLVNIDSVDNPGMKRVIPGDSANSLLYQVLLGPVGASQRMPQVGEPLAQESIDRIQAWIDDGAKND